MKIVVFGGTGLIGRQVVELLRSQGHEAIPASPSTGVDSVTGLGLDEAMAGADVVVDLTNTADFDEKVVVPFFSASSRNLLAAEKKAGVRHHVALSVVGTDRIGAIGYFAGKTAQEKAIREGGVPYTLLRATQFFEFIPMIADAGTRDGSVYVTSHLMQPMAAADVARIVAETAVEPATNGVVEIAGPERAGINEFVARVLAAHNDPRAVVIDIEAGYFGMPIEETSIVPLGDARIGNISLKEWLS
ncbi:SDR family oxidoreductase [Arthrobacter sp. R-11]|uniref:SDR family oxidoreductase n=1 Tax=Arthrobacter sp. R-11 TaxID=3404053 RepID=UPI003CF337DC